MPRRLKRLENFEQPRRRSESWKPNLPRSRRKRRRWKRKNPSKDQHLYHDSFILKFLFIFFYRFWANHSQTTLLHGRASDTLASLNAAIAQTQRDLASLARTNVYNDAFCIGHDGHGIGTVNGLRLGRVSGVNVDWAEINAAWGWTLLLLYTIAKKVGYEFETWVFNLDSLSF